MQTATPNQHLIVGAPGSLLQFCAHLETITKQIAVIGDQIDRATKYLCEQYALSPLAKKRTAKQNLTAACTNALVRMRRTYRELFAVSYELTTAPCTQVCELLSEQQQANAPNCCTHKIKLRQQLAKAGQHNRPD